MSKSTALTDLISLSLKQAHALEASKSSLEATIISLTEQHKQELLNYTQKQYIDQTTISLLQKQVDEKDTFIKALQKSIASTQLHLTKSTGDFKEQATMVQTLTDEVKTLKSIQTKNTDEHKIKYSQLSQQVTDYIAKNTQLEKQNSIAQATIAKLETENRQHRMFTTNSEEQIKDYKKRLSTSENTIRGLKEQLKTSATKNSESMQDLKLLGANLLETRRRSNKRLNSNEVNKYKIQKLKQTTLKENMQLKEYLLDAQKTTSHLSGQLRVEQEEKLELQNKLHNLQQCISPPPSPPSTPPPRLTSTDTYMPIPTIPSTDRDHAPHIPSFNFSTAETLSLPPPPPPFMSTRPRLLPDPRLSSPAYTRVQFLPPPPLRVPPITLPLAIHSRGFEHR